MGVQIIAHQTHSHNKQDAEHGFWAMRNQWKLGKIRLPYADESAHVVQPLINEAYLWPSAGMSDDGLMAYWMYRIKLPQVQSQADVPLVVTAPAPSWLR